MTVLWGCTAAFEQGWVVIDGERLEGELISLCGAGGVGEAINENWLAASRIKDQLQPRSPPRRIYNPLYCGLGSFGFNSDFTDT